MDIVFVVVGGVIGALLVFAAMLLVGQRVVQRLGLGQEHPEQLPEAVRYSPPAPPLRAAHDPEGAKVVAALQARRWALCNRAHAISCTGDKKKTAAGDSCIDAITLDEASLTQAEATMTAVEQMAPDTTPAADAPAGNAAP